MTDNTSTQDITLRQSRPRKTPQEWSHFKIDDDDGDDQKSEQLTMEQFMRDCYKRGDDETKRAMMKSYLESGGTVLNMNWTEVCSKKIEPRPPSGLETKQK